MRRLWVAVLFLCLVSKGGAMAVNPVVVELFESQGCSSCPPAENVMKALQKEFGSSVVLLTYHVDYWDSLGWKDTFSDADYTERQKEYARAFGQDSIYTPEMVIQGETGFVGSDLRHARKEINACLTGRQARLQATRPVLGLTLKPGAEGLVNLSIQLTPELTTQARNVIAVLYENAPSVHVLRGENRGETMTGDFAVRKIVEVPLSASGHLTVPLRLENTWNRMNLGVAVLVKGSSPQILAVQSQAI